MPELSTRSAGHLERAEECLRLADISTKDDLRAEYRRMADHYVALAESERKIAESLERVAAEQARRDSGPARPGQTRRYQRRKHDRNPGHDQSDH